jgi:hypothetical protein
VCVGGWRAGGGVVRQHMRIRQPRCDARKAAAAAAAAATARAPAPCARGLCVCVCVCVCTRVCVCVRAFAARACSHPLARHTAPRSV